MNAAPKRKILILYTELAGYTVACLNRFLEKYPDVDVHLVRWPVNDEAPFHFSFGGALRVYERKKYDRESLLRLAAEISPGVILCSGWVDKDYLAVCRAWNKKIPVVLTMDNKWRGTWKQQIARVAARFSLLKNFRFAWVPGASQKQYALRLGFLPQHIFTGFYSADTGFFSRQYEANLPAKEKQFPHRFIYAGRYYDFKGIAEMWEAFAQLKKEEPSCDWELWCLGTGDISPAQHPAIRHFGFVQPDGIPAIAKDAGVFILPSRIEPWGVAVQEFAAAGFPLLLSDAVGAAETFLQNEVNGFSFRAGDAGAILAAMRKITKLPDEKLIQMGKESHKLGCTVSPDTWSDTLYKLSSPGSMIPKS